jgi:hypothetical protein
MDATTNASVVVASWRTSPSTRPNPRAEASTITPVSTKFAVRFPPLRSRGASRVPGEVEAVTQEGLNQPDEIDEPAHIPQRGGVESHGTAVRDGCSTDGMSMPLVAL